MTFTYRDPNINKTIEFSNQYDLSYYEFMSGSSGLTKRLGKRIGGEVELVTFSVSTQRIAKFIILYHSYSSKIHVRAPLKWYREHIYPKLDYGFGGMSWNSYSTPLEKDIWFASSQEIYVHISDSSHPDWTKAPECFKDSKSLNRIISVKLD